MGRIKSTLIKRTARILVKEPMFGDTFEHNKKILANSMPSKKTRNRIAGYIGHLRRMEQIKAQREAAKPTLAQQAMQEEMQQPQYLQ